MKLNSLSNHLRGIAESIDAIAAKREPAVDQAINVDDLIYAHGRLANLQKQMDGMLHKEYRFVHITDLAHLHENHIEAFCDELPTLIGSLKETLACLNIPEGKIAISKIIPHITWKADDYDAAVITLRMGETKLGSVTVEGENANNQA